MIDQNYFQYNIYTYISTVDKHQILISVILINVNFINKYNNWAFF